jgi:hypothetical protein
LPKVNSKALSIADLAADHALRSTGLMEQADIFVVVPAYHENAVLRFTVSDLLIFWILDCGRG